MTLASRINRTLRKVPAWPIYCMGFGYAAWLLWLGLSNQMGADPVKVLEHSMGKAALYMLIISLCVTPLRQLSGVNLLKYRRALGLTCFFFVACHLLVWAVLDVQRVGEVWADILKRPYVTIGMLAFALLVPLAVTSNNYSMRKLGGAAWANLHKLVYPAAILGGVHYLMLVKGWQIEPMVFLALIITLIAWRYRPKRFGAFRSDPASAGRQRVGGLRG